MDVIVSSTELESNLYCSLTDVCLAIAEIDAMIYSRVTECVGTLRAEWTALCGKRQPKEAVVRGQRN